MTYQPFEHEMKNWPLNLYLMKLKIQCPRATLRGKEKWHIIIQLMVKLN